MKIAVTSTFLGHMARGVETWARDMAAELHRRGADVTLFKGGGPAELDYERQVRCANHQSPIWAKVTRLTRRGGWRFGLADPYSLQHVTFARAVIPELRKGRFDIVHMQDPLVARTLQRARRRGRHNARVILGHGTEEPFEFLNELDHVQELAPYYLELDRQKGLAPDRRWFALPNFVDCRKYSPGDLVAARKKFDIPVDRFVVLDVAAIKSTHKRVDWLAQEMALLRKTHPQVLVVVAGASTPQTEEVVRVSKQALGDNLRLLTDLSHHAMPDLYRAANVFAHAALTEMMPIALLETLATGVPIVAHTFPIFEWILGAGGITVDLTRHGNMATALGTLIDQPSKLAELSTAARSQVLANFETTRVVDQILQMYQRVLEPS